MEHTLHHQINAEHGNRILAYITKPQREIWQGRSSRLCCTMQAHSSLSLSRVRTHACMHSRRACPFPCCRVSPEGWFFDTYEVELERVATLSCGVGEIAEPACVGP